MRQPSYHHKQTFPPPSGESHSYGTPSRQCSDLLAISSTAPCESSGYAATERGRFGAKEAKGPELSSIIVVVVVVVETVPFLSEGTRSGGPGCPRYWGFTL